MAGDLLRQWAAVGDDPDLCRTLLAQLEQTLHGRSLRFMEVCGTHTVAIFQSGLRSLLPDQVKHLSGPGCPVCVTHDADIETFLELARRPRTILATFGDLLRVPGANGRTLKHAQADGATVRIVYSPLDAVQLAQDNPGHEIIFPGIGFETTAPLVAAAVMEASRRGIANLSILSLHKLVAPALRALLDEGAAPIDGFLMPGHVAVVTGERPFDFLPREYGKPAVIGGFTPVDILLALNQLAAMVAEGRPAVGNAYARAVAPDGNPRARELMHRVFQPCDALWRGLDTIPASGLQLKPEFAAFDAGVRFGVKRPDVRPKGGCRCGAVLKGALSPAECPLFGKSCTPANPIGPCMVSSEGSCAAWFKYGVT